MPAGEEAAETPLDRRAMGTVDDVHHGCFPLRHCTPKQPRVALLVRAAGDSGGAKPSSHPGYVTIVVSTKGQAFSSVHLQVCTAEFSKVVCMQKQAHPLVKKL